MAALSAGDKPCGKLFDRYTLAHTFLAQVLIGRGLVDHEQIAIEAIVGVACEPAAPGIDLQEPVDRLGLDALNRSGLIGGSNS